ncbi:MAG: hypothetical protein Q8O33_18405 [Pseudomonadota bacterium]|nr:hypothetical protein [Pseudomonadota bacterium]
MAQRRPPNRSTRQAIAGQVGTVSSALGQSYVSYHPLLATVTGNVKAALFLSHAISWSRYVHKSQPDRDGWFWLRASDWHEGAGLSGREQATARIILKGMGILEEKRIGVPAKIWYRVNLDKLGHLVAASAGRQFEEWSWDRAAMLHLLGQPVPCHRILIKVAESVVGGLILSYLFRATRRDLSDGGDGEWMHIPVGHTREFLGITLKQQRRARERLRQAGLVEETFERVVQPKLLTRLNLGQLGLECAKKANEIHCLQDSANMFAGFRNLDCGILQTRVAQSAYLELPKAQNKECPNRITEVAQSADQAVRKGPITKEENYKREPLQKAAPEAQAPSPAPAVGSSSELEIILPEKLLAGEATAARNWLMPLEGELRQQVADEWAGLLSLAARGIKPMYSRLGVLNTLVKRAKGLDSEPFTPCLCFEVAAARQRRQEIESVRQSQIIATPSAPRDLQAMDAGRALLKKKMSELWPTRRPS